MRRQSKPLSLALAPLFGVGLSGCDMEPSVAKAEPAQPAAAPLQAGDDPFPPGPYGDRDPALAKQLVGGGALLLDVRSAAEFSGGHLDGAVNIAHTQIGERIAEIRELQDQDPHRPIVLYCRSGHRAGLAKRELAAAGFDRVTNLGGIADWPG
ncbi:MAG: rhodanese-like domain-containing protein [Enhygromyxa sp.]